jgi:hypothetical protein
MSVPEVAIVQPSAVVMEVVLVGAVQVAAILFLHTMCHDLQPIQVNTMLRSKEKMLTTSKDMMHW